MSVLSSEILGPLPELLPRKTKTKSRERHGSTLAMLWVTTVSAAGPATARHHHQTRVQSVLRLRTVNITRVGQGARVILVQIYTYKMWGVMVIIRMSLLLLGHPRQWYWDWTSVGTVWWFILVLVSIRGQWRKTLVPVTTWVRSWRAEIIVTTGFSVIVSCGGVTVTVGPRMSCHQICLKTTENPWKLWRWTTTRQWFPRTTWPMVPPANMSHNLEKIVTTPPPTLPANHPLLPLPPLPKMVML